MDRRAARARRRLRVALAAAVRAAFRDAQGSAAGTFECPVLSVSNSATTSSPKVHARLSGRGQTLGLAPDAPLPATHFLAISGGGDDGAFGSGLLVGWTDAGDRPQFDVVTGVSTGS